MLHELENSSMLIHFAIVPLLQLPPHVEREHAHVTIMCVGDLLLERLASFLRSPTIIPLFSMWNKTILHQGTTDIGVTHQVIATKCIRANYICDLDSTTVEALNITMDFVVRELLQLFELHGSIDCFVSSASVN